MKIKTSLSLEPEVHAALKALADKEKRSMSNFLETFIDSLAKAGSEDPQLIKKSYPATTMALSCVG